MSATKEENRKAKRGSESDTYTSTSSEMQPHKKKKETHSKSKSKTQDSDTDSHSPSVLSVHTLSRDLPSVSSLIDSAEDDLEKLISYRDFGKDLFDKAAKKAEALISQKTSRKTSAGGDDSKVKHKDICHLCGTQIAKKKYGLPCGQMVDGGGFADLEEALRDRGGCGKMCHVNCMQKTECEMIVLCDDCVDDYDCLDCDQCAGY